MRQALRTFVFLAATAPAALAGDAASQARKLITAGDLKSAAGVLEEALGASPAPSAADRRTLVDLLKESYRGLARDARAAGKLQDAASYEDDLAILEAAVPAAAASAPEPAPALTPAPATTPAPAPARSLPPIPSPRPAPALAPTPAPAPADPVSIPHVEKAPEAVPARDMELPPLGGPTTAPPPGAAKVSPPPRTRDDGVGRAAAVAPEPEPEPGAQVDELAEADALFNAKKYDQAGKIYARLAGKGKLPAARNKVWAYCRWANIVARINAGPKSKQEWDALDREVDSVQRLTPGNWFGDYLKDLVAEGRSGRRPVAKGPGLAVRGASPDEPEPTPVRPAVPSRPRVDPQMRKAGAEALELPAATDDLPPPAPTPPVGDEPPPLEGAAPPSAKAPARAQAAAPVAWQVRETASFRIFHTDPALAARAAEAAEAVRTSQGTRWGSAAVQRPWTPRCDIYLYPTPDDFARMTGQPGTSPGFSTMGVGGGKVVARRVNLRADHPQLIAAVLPHEVTHVVLADVFVDQQVPRWADEGMAVLAEPLSEQDVRAAELNAPLAEGRVFGLDKLMEIDYPESKDWSLYYAQSVSLTQFLMSQGTAAQFVSFVKDSQKRGPDSALRANYRIAGLDDLETRWREHARRESSRLVASDRAPTAAK